MWRVLGGLLLLLSLGMARAGERVALLIGNASYAEPAYDLANPANDATALAAALRGLGFRTRVVIDADRAGAEAALEDFGRAAAGAEIAFFFFAGHGVQIAGENRLLTADLGAGAAEALRRASLSLDTVQATLAAAAPELGVIVLDACRDNPLSADPRAARGLARARGGSGLLIAYATDPGNVAYDGAGPDSVFTTALLDNIATPGLDVRLMFGRVRQAVLLATRGRQVPWVEESVLGEHELNPAPASAAPVDAVEADLAAWREATAAGGAAAYRRYLDARPDGLFRAFAEERLAAPAARPAPADASRILAAADPASAADALARLGFLPRTEGSVEPAQLAAAFESYAAEMGGSAPSLDGLYLDAAQTTVMLATGTAQRLRGELATLAAIRKTLASAEGARAELAALASAGNAEAGAALSAADADLAAIRAHEAEVQARLDQSRGFYADLVASGGHELRPYLRRSLAGLVDASRTLPGSESRTIGDAQLFVRHASEDGTARPEGSMRWLTDFLPGG
ncbi:caspase family protein [Amaricoccus solimangrovi]|nr:caspase family protein [Amaricoccus solimangrovi]